MRVLKVIYVLAIAAALIALVVVGVEAFYPGPSYPEYDPPPVDYNSTEYQEWEQEWTNAIAAYDEEAAVHDRNIFLIVLPSGLG
jgi:sugar phosphate isomerase/epimerase